MTNKITKYLDIISYELNEIIEQLEFLGLFYGKVS